MSHTRALAPWLVLGAGVVAAMHIGKLPPTIPILQAQLDLSLNQLGFLLSAIQAAGMCLALLIGMWAGKVGLKRLLMVGLLLLMVASALGAASSHFYVLFAARLLEGLGFLCVIVPAPALLRQLVALDKLKVMMAYWGTYMGLGVALSLFITPRLLQHMAWPQIWLGFAVMTLGMILLVAKWVALSDAHKNTPSVDAWPLFKATLKHPPAWLLGFLFACYTSQWFAIMGFLPTVYVQAHIESTEAGTLTALACLSNVIGSIASGLLLQRGVRALTLLSVGFMVMVTGTVLMFAGVGHIAFVWQYLGVLAFSTMGGLIPGVVFAYAGVLVRHPNMVSGNIGWIQQQSSLGQFCLPPIMGAWVAWWGGWQQAWMLCVFLSILGVVAAFILQKVIDRGLPT